MMDEGNKRWLCVYRHGSFVTKAIRSRLAPMVIMDDLHSNPVNISSF